MNMIFSFFCQDVQAQMEFYQALFDWPERLVDRSPIYRSLQTANSTLGFHAPLAFELLGLDEWEGQDLASQPAGLPTFQLDSPARVDQVVRKVIELGARVVKAPFATYYGQWQAVLADPEDHVFRVASVRLPKGIEAPSLSLLI